MPWFSHCLAWCIRTRATYRAGVSPTTREKRSAKPDREAPISLASSCRSEEHTSELQSLMRISYAVFCLKKKKNKTIKQTHLINSTTNHPRQKDSHYRKK